MMRKDVLSDYILTIEYPPGDRTLDDAVQALLFLTTTLGSTIGDRHGNTLVEAYFSSPADRDAALSTLRGLDVSLNVEERPRTDWLALYRQSLHPLPMGRRLVIVPDPSIETAGSRIRIVIPQERAFGTGSHESTALCLEFLESIGLTGKTCADIGTGSGILAIAMAKLGARQVVAFDNDLDGFGVVQRNLARNEIAPRAVLQFYGELDSLRGWFDLITMNIIPEVIGPLLPSMRQMMKRESSLIVSGITRDRREELMGRAVNAGYAIAGEKSKNEWWAAELRLR